MLLRGGVEPPGLPGHIEVQAWSANLPLATTYVDPFAFPPRNGFRVKAQRDGTTWSVDELPAGTVSLAVQRWGDGSVVGIARPVRVDAAAEVEDGAPVTLEWIEQDAMVTIACTTRFATSSPGGRYVVRWDGLPLAAIDGATAVVAPADVDVEVAVSDWFRANDFGRPPPQSVRVARGERRELQFELPAGRGVRLAAVDARGRKVKSIARLWRLDGDRTPRPWWDARLDIEPAVSMRVVPGRYGALVETKDAGSGWREFEVVEGSGDDIALDIPVEASGVRVRLTLEVPDVGERTTDLVRIERVAAGRPAERAFWKQSLGQATGGTVETGCLPPGDYELTVRTGPRGGPTDEWMRRVRVAEGLEEMRITLPPLVDRRALLGSVVIDLEPPSHSRSDRVRVVLESLDAPGEWARVGHPDPGWRLSFAPTETVLFTALAPGRYRATAVAAWGAPERRGVPVDFAVSDPLRQSRVRVAPP